MKRKTIPYAVVSALLVLAACTYDKVDPIYITNDGPTLAPIPALCPSPTPTTPSYAADVAPIITARCSPCHTGGRSDGSVAVGSKSQLISAIQNNSCLPVVQLGQMPKEAGLPLCEINILIRWNNAGFPD